METQEYVIRSMNETDVSQIMKIWLHSNQEAHDFISSDYWKEQASNVRSALFKAEVYVCETGERIYGFAGLEEDYLAGIFVQKDSRYRGIGKLLLKRCMSGRKSLTLHVYQKNEAAFRFYRKNGFRIIAEDIDDRTGEKEYEMKWEAE